MFDTVENSLESLKIKKNKAIEKQIKLVLSKLRKEIRKGKLYFDTRSLRDFNYDRVFLFEETKLWFKNNGFIIKPSDKYGYNNDIQISFPADFLENNKNETVSSKIDNLTNKYKNFNIFSPTFFILCLLTTIAIVVYHLWFTIIFVLLSLFTNIYKYKKLKTKLRVAQIEYDKEMVQEWDKIIEESDEKFKKYETNCSK